MPLCLCVRAPPFATCPSVSLSSLPPCPRAPVSPRLRAPVFLASRRAAVSPRLRASMPPCCRPPCARACDWLVRWLVGRFAGRPLGWWAGKFENSYHKIPKPRIISIQEKRTTNYQTFQQNKFWSELGGRFFFQICLGPEINLAGSAKFLSQNMFENKVCFHHRHYPQIIVVLCIIAIITMSYMFVNFIVH